MKKSMLITALLVFFVGANVKAQSLIGYTWDAYKTKFKIGSDWTVEESTGTSFSAGKKNINLSIYPRKGGTNTYADLKAGLVAWVKESNVTINADGYQELADLNGYHGCMVDGSTQGWPVFMMNVVDPDYTDIHLYVWVSYDESSRDIALQVLKSFTPN